MKANKRLGQHFLTDRNILGRIVDALDPAPGDVVLEIGAGKGSLTEILLSRGLSVIAIEKDRRLAAELREQGAGSGEQATVIAGDALRLDWLELANSVKPIAPRSPPSLLPSRSSATSPTTSRRPCSTRRSRRRFRRAPCFSSRRKSPTG